jgi:serine/threonine protein kinase
MSGEVPEPSDQFWSDPVWSGSGGGTGTVANGTSTKQKDPKECYRCKATTNSGATISFADGSKAFFCKPCAVHKLSKRASLVTVPSIVVSPTTTTTTTTKSTSPTSTSTTTAKRSSGHDKVCVMCRKIGGTGARITLASGAVEWFCKQCALQPALARTESAVLGSYTQAERAGAGVAATGGNYDSSAMIARQAAAAAEPATPPVRTASQHYLAAIPGVDDRVSALPLPVVVQTLPAQRVSPRAAVSPREAATIAAAASPRTPAAAGARPGENYQSVSLVERERLGRGFEQCLIAADDVVRAEQVGEGTQGLVFRGRWRGVDVAIKERRDASVAYLEQFRAEALRMHSIAVHENVCQFLGVLLSPSFAIVTRFYPLGCLEDHVYNTRAEVLLTPAFVRRALLGVARGVRHLHGLGMVHRDIACRNVLLEDASERYTADMRAAEQCEPDAPVISVVVTDFGMSRTGAGGALEGHTVANFGPIKFMSPEQLTEQRWSGASDVYSFGVLCGELLERAPPMLGIDMLDAAQLAINGTRGDLLPPPHRDMAQLVRWCWEVEPTGRPSMAECVKALKIMPAAAFAVPAVAPTRTERKARGEANKLAIAQQQQQKQLLLQAPPSATGRPPSPSLRARLGNLLRRADAADSPPLSPTRDASPRGEPRNPLFGVSLQAAIDADGADAHGVPLILAQCMAMLRAHRQHSTLDHESIAAAAAAAAAGPASSPRAALRADDAAASLVMHVEGIFRLSGSMAQIERVKRSAVHGGHSAREALMLLSDPHTIAGVMKQWLRELNDRVIDATLLFDMLEAMQQHQRDVRQCCAALRQALERTSAVRRTILEQLLWLFQSVVLHEPVTRMTPQALAVVFAPSLTDCSMAQMKPAIELLRFVIQNALDVFDFETDQSYAFIPETGAKAQHRALADSRKIREQFVERLVPAASYGVMPPQGHALPQPPPRGHAPPPPPTLQYVELRPELPYEN